MDVVYNLVKLIVGILNIGFLSYLSINDALYRGIKWWNILAAIILVPLIVKSLPFAKRNESVWTFFIGLVATIPFNLKISRCLVMFFFDYANMFSRSILFVVFFMCLLSIEEIILGILTRIIWKHQEESFSIIEEEADDLGYDFNFD